MSLLFLKRSATTNSTSVINHNSSGSSNNNNVNHNSHGHCKTSSNASVSVQNLVSLTTRHRYSFLTTPDLTADLAQSVNDLNNSHSKREREKLNVLKEVISSEKKYLNDLKEIVDGYYDEIAKFKDPDFINHIFSNIREIYEFTKGFYLMLEGSNLDEIAIATCFIKMHRNFSLLYSTYCQNYKIAYITSEKLEKDPSIGKIIEKVRIKFGHHLKMATYLQLPVLRITKYHLLLQRYLKLLDEDSFAHSQILEALDLMRQVNDQINKEMSSDLDKPFDDDLFETSATSNLNMLKLVGLFGSVLKQGNLILNETKTYHHVIVFQNMLLIRKSDLYLSKVICTISNENLGFSPISNGKHCNKSFTVIDYSQKKSGENSEYCQYTLKTRSIDEKKAWQACILQCILNGYGKKLPDNIKKRVLKIENPKITSKYESIRMKLSSFKRIKDLRHTIKRSNSQELKSKQQLIEATNAHTTTQPNSRRRLSEHFQSSIKKLLDKKPDKTDSLLKSFRKDKLSNRLFSNQKFKSNCSILNESTSNETKAQEDNSQIEIKLGYDQASHLMNTSYMSVYSSFEKIDQSTILKFENILNENTNSNKKLNEFDFCYCDSNDSFSSTSKDIILKQTEEIISSNSEEGYYSNHDSSSTVSTLINEQLMDLDEPPSSKQVEFSNCKFHIPVDYSRFSYNCYSNENKSNNNDHNNNYNNADPQQTLTTLPRDLNESQVRLTRNKFSSLSSLKQDMVSKQDTFQNINQSNSYVSEIKLFFDNHQAFIPLSQYSREAKLNMSSESDVDFKINIKDLISKFEKNK